MQVKQTEIADLIPYANNSRTHSDSQVAQIAASIKEFGFNNPILLDGDKGIIAGHGRLLAARKLNLDKVPTIELEHLTDAQRKAYIIADNKLALNADWDMELLSLEVDDLKNDGFDLSLIGFDENELGELFEKRPTEGADEVHAKLADRFGVPPFSILNAREGWWQDRKRAWLSLGIKSEEGRDQDLLDFSSLVAKFGNRGGTESNTSVFDPVLCELIYRWFCGESGLVLDPFAGGSVRGIVAAKLKREYIGYELSEKQVKANIEQAERICDNITPTWVNADSYTINNAEIEADLVFTCPPYADLEVYSDNPKDLSTMPYKEFLEAYRDIIYKSCAKLKTDRFAAIVVGEVRNKNGEYYNFVGDTVQAFKDAGLVYYNEMILVTAVGSLPIRVGRQFEAGRKIGKTHQNILVFVKGDPKKATKATGKSSFGEIEDKVKVKVSAKSLMLDFVPCSPGFINNVCKGKCCDAPSRTDGCLVTIHHDETNNIENRGGVIVDGLLKPLRGKKGCPFKKSNLCSLHETKDKPFGCIASPFTLNKNNTLIVRNRYKMLPCYKATEGKLPAYEAHNASLNLIFGKDESKKIVSHLNKGLGDIEAMMPLSSYNKLVENDLIKKQAKLKSNEKNFPSIKEAGQ